MFKLPQEKSFSPRLSVHPYQRPPSSDHRSSLSSVHGGRKLTQDTDSAAAKLSSSFLTQMSASFGPRAYPPSTQYASVTEEILLACRDMTTAVQMKNWDIATIPGYEFSSADFIARNNLNPAEAEKYFGLFGLTPDGYEYLERRQKADFINRMSSLPEELCSSYPPIEQSTSSDQPLAAGPLSVEIQNTVCIIAFDIWASKKMTLIEFCEVNGLKPDTAYRRFKKMGTWSLSDRSKRSVLKLYEDNYESLKESVLNALETVDKGLYISLKGKVDVGKFGALLYKVSPLGIKAKRKTKRPLPSTSE